MKTWIALTLTIAAVGPHASAASVYRCGNTYSQSPCAAAQTVEVGDARSTAQQTEAHRVADNERRLAADMRRERLEDQRSSRSVGAASLSGSPPIAKPVVAASAHHKKKKASAKPAATTDFVAFDPSSRKRRTRG
jgi:hypothetical protein